jgi:neutral amino acid transport system permease protein
MLVIGLNMTYSVLKFSNFAHAEFVTLGMFLGWWSLQVLTYLIPSDAPLGDLINNIFIHACFSFIGVGTFGIICDKLVFSRLRNSQANATTFTVSSIGIGIIARYVFGMIWGELPVPGAKYSSIPSFPGFIPEFLRETRYNIALLDTPFGFQRIAITNYELYIIFIAFILVYTVDYFFKNTKLGIAMRATSDSHELAQVTGIDTKRIIYYTWFIAAGITGFAGAWIRAKQNNFTLLDGSEVYLLPIFAAAILGGVGSFKGGIISSFILAFSRQGTVILFTQFQLSNGILPLEDILNIVTFAPGYADGIGFVILIIVLLFRPQGISGTVDVSRARV